MIAPPTILGPSSSHSSFSPLLIASDPSLCQSGSEELVKCPLRLREGLQR
ncbi:hypothetical protein F2Q69_00060161 [Brassica cretica]|uniref:Uncharacterized protein n=2 Tax=Brassica cretica TaxID=69181 RepID=A0ABQ7AAW4_BRACR|nr:hypothetical protein DY000_02054092 [Brassica cretica]KAF3570414.1 hypothetical protein F2Q69_00060161 [Brassica cretica]